MLSIPSFVLKPMLCHIDDLLHIGFNTKEGIDNIKIIYRLKEGFGPPDWYLGPNFEKLKLEDWRVVCSTNCVDYLKSAIVNLNNSLVVDKTAIKNYGDWQRP